MQNKKVSTTWFANYDSAILIILVVLTLAPLFILSFYTHPFADDFAYTAQTIQNGFWGAQKYWYYNWQGRYFSTALLSLNPLVFGAEWAYKLNPILLLLLQLIATYWLCSSIFKNLSIVERLGVTSIFICLHIMFLPDIGQQIFWQNSSYACFVADILTFFLFASMINYYQSVHKQLYFILSCLFAIAIIGSYEINMLLVDMSISLFVFIQLIKKQNLVFPITLLAVCILFSLIDVTAPGNAMRAFAYHQAHKLSFTIRQSYVFGKDALIHWLPYMLLGSLLLASFLPERIVLTDRIKAIFSVPILLSLVASAAIPFLGMFIFFWSEGKYPPLRTVNGIYFYTGIGIMYSSISSIIYFKQRFSTLSVPVYFKTAIYSILLLVFVFKPNNITMAYKDIQTGIAKQYDTEMTERNKKLHATIGDSCIVKPIMHISATIPFGEIGMLQPSTPDPKFFNLIYGSFCSYYHKKYVAVQ